MKTVSLRELHLNTGRWVRLAAQQEEVQVSERGRVVARIVPEPEPALVPYFARRVESPEFRRLAARGRLARGRDSTLGISEDREDRAL